MRSNKVVQIPLLAALLACAHSDALAAWSTLGSVTHASHSPAQARFATASGAVVEIAFISPDVVHVRVSPGEPGRENSYALAGMQQPVALAMSDADGKFELSARANASARVVVQATPELTISVFDASGQLVIADDAARPMAFDRANGAIEVSKQRDASELYYGFGEKALPSRAAHRICRIPRSGGGAEAG